MIVCIGWGSLIWCQKSLSVVGDWQSDGPDLPVEFARKSSGDRITLVICDESPVVKTYWAALDVQTLDEAKQMLATREGVKDCNIRHSIGHWNRTSVSNHPGADAVGQWAANRDLEGVVWTALKPGMEKTKRGPVPTVEQVLAHLRGLEGEKRKTAEEYVRLAPRQIVTPYRKAIEDALGWTPKGLL